MTANDYSKRLLTLASLVAAFLFLSVMSAFGAEANPKREVRSVWMSTAWAIDWPSNRAATSASVTAQKKQALEYIDKLEAAGFNAIYFQVRPFADRFYAKNSWTDPKTGTTYKVAEPWSAYLTGTRGTAPYGDWDPLQFWIDECHKRGIELHAWVNPYRIVSNLTGTAEDKAVADWTITYASKTVFNPAMAQTIARIQNVCRVLTGNYDIDGIVFDDYFYPDGMGSLTDSTAPDYANYQTYKNNGGTLGAADWRRDNVNRMVKAVCTTIHDIKPWVQFGISPAGAGDGSLKKYNPEGLPLLSKYCKASDWAYASLACDPIAWLRAGTVDYISPQLYWRENSTTNAFTPMSKWWSEIAQAFGRHFYASHSESWLAESGTTEANIAEAAAQVKANRANTFDGNFGSVFYSAKNVITGLSDNLGADAFSCKAVAPAMTWKAATPQGTVTSLTLNNRTLRWDAKDNVRYICYAVPLDVVRDQAASENGGLKADYIAGVTYTNSFALPADKDADKYWYAVSVLDRYGNEYELATLGEPQPGPKQCASPTLIAPSDKAQLLENPVFTAQCTDNAVLEISNDDFQTVCFTGVTSWKTDGNGNITYSLPLAYFADGVYSWRVRATKDAHEDGISDVRSFIVGGKSDRSSFAGTTDPDNYQMFSSLQDDNHFTLNSMWMRRPGIDALDINAELNRDMVSRASDDQTCDIVYIVSRATAAADAESFLLRYDALTGRSLPALQLTYDDRWANGTYPANGILLDDANQLVTHTLSVAGTTLSVGTVDAVSGAVTTWYSAKTDKRVDHLDVYGTIADGETWYIFAPTNSGTVYRITMQGNTRVAIDEMAITLGNAARIHALSPDRFWVNGQQTSPALYEWGNSTPLARIADTPGLSPLNNNCTDMVTFSHDGDSYIFYQYNYANEATGSTSQWALAKGTDVNQTMADAELLWVFPTAGAGTHKIVSGDFGAPVSVLQTGHQLNGAYSTMSYESADNTYLYGYSYGQGLVAYSLNKSNTTTSVTSVNNEKIMTTINADGSIAFGSMPVHFEIYNASGRLVDAGFGTSTKALGSRGIYMVRVRNASSLRIAKVAI